MSLSGIHALTGELLDLLALALGDGRRLVAGMSARQLRLRPSLPSARKAHKRFACCACK